MSVRRCSTCALDYPKEYSGPCLKCDGKLSFIYNAMSPMLETEFLELRRVHRLRSGEEPEALAEADEAALANLLDGFLALFDELEAEAKRRGERWTALDIYLEREGRAV